MPIDFSSPTPAARPSDTSSLADDIQSVAQRHGFSSSAAQHIFEALARGGGAMAQFDHPEFGGPGQWMRGGMVMVSDLFNDRLKARIQSLCADLAVVLSTHPKAEQPADDTASSLHRPSDATGRYPGPAVSAGTTRFASSPGWPNGLGPPSSTGSQNGMRYAWFAAARRLTIEVDGHVTVYDTGEHVIQGCSQQQSTGRSLVFTSQTGEVELSRLPIVSTPTPDRPTSGPARASAPPPAPEVGTSPHDDLLALVDRLAELRSRDVLTEDEFLQKKGELLSRL